MAPLFHRIFLIGQLLILGLASLGWWGAKQLEVRRIELPAETLRGAGPLRIAFFSDVHNDNKLFSRLIEEIEQEQPDLIIFGGDLVLSQARFTRTRWVVKGFRRLQEIAPVYAMLGNQDYEKFDAVQRVFQTAGVPILRNEALDWTAPNGATIRLIGLGDWIEGDENPALCMKRSDEEEKPVLLLSHDPESRWLLRRYDWDFMLSGHTHGGQLGIPFTDRHLSFRSSMPAGLYDFEHNRHVFVSRGIGSIMGMRFFCTPELVILEQK